MTSTRRFIFFTKIVPVIGTVVTVVLLLLIFSEASRLPEITASDREGRGAGTLPEQSLRSDINEVSLSPMPDSAASGSETLENYRLAGTFLTVTSSGIAQPQAIIQTPEKEQLIVMVGDIFSGIKVTRILGDRVTLIVQGKEVVMLLKSDALSLSGITTVSNANTSDIHDKTQSRLARLGGQRVSGNRWHFSRDGLIDYYNELRNEPGRLLDVFDSMKPVRSSDNKITGYRLGIEGEKDFFDAIGLNEGDIIRSVKSLKMTNRNLAEAMIKSFVKGHVSTIVLEVERAGEKQKLLYLVDPDDLK